MMIGAKNNAADEGMTTDTLDLSFFGVASMVCPIRSFLPGRASPESRDMF